MLTSTVFASLEAFTRTGGFELSLLGAIPARGEIEAALRVSRWGGCATRELDNASKARSVHRRAIHCLPVCDARQYWRLGPVGQENVYSSRELDQSGNSIYSGHDF